jgi:hypothetical protein
MDCRILMRKVLVLCALCVMPAAFAQGATASVLTLGFNFHVGPVNDSVAGATAYSGSLAVERGTSVVRFSLGFGGNYSDAILTSDDQEYSVNLIGGELRTGFAVHPFRGGALLPYIGLYGTVGAELMRASSPPPYASISEVALGYAYEAEAGMMIRTGSNSYWRLLGAYRVHTVTYGGRPITLDTISFRTAIAF